MTELIKHTIEFLKVLSDPTRLEIIELLKDGYKTSLDLQKTLKRSQSTISQQLKILINANLIDYDRVNKKNHYFIKDKRIYKVLATMQTFISSINKEKLKELVDIDIYNTLT